MTAPPRRPPRPGAAGTYDQPVRWAFSAAMYRRRRGHRGPPPTAAPGRVIALNGVTVFRSSRAAGYGESTHARGYLTHLVEAVYTAWRRGRLCGVMVRWLCGGSTIWFRLSDEAEGPLCPLCLATVGRVHARVALEVR